MRFKPVRQEKCPFPEFSETGIFKIIEGLNLIYNYCFNIQANIKGATIVASLSTINLGV